MTVVGPALITSDTTLGIGACVPGRGRESMTAPRGSLLGRSLTSPASKPATSSAFSANSRLIPITPGTVPYRCPPLTTSVTRMFGDSRLPGAGCWSSTVPFGAAL